MTRNININYSDSRNPEPRLSSLLPPIRHPSRLRLHRTTYLSNAEKAAIGDVTPPRPPVRPNAPGVRPYLGPGDWSRCRGSTRFCGLYSAGLQRRPLLNTVRGASFSTNDRCFRVLNVEVECFECRPSLSSSALLLVVVAVVVRFSVGSHCLVSTLAWR